VYLRASAAAAGGHGAEDAPTEAELPEPRRISSSPRKNYGDDPKTAARV
jgi:hypothetical protein